MVNMGTVWDRATEFLSDNLSAVVPLALFAIFLPMSIQANLDPLAKAGGPAAVAIQIISLILSVVSLWGQIAIIALAIDPAAGRAPAILAANKRLLPVIGVALLMLLGALLLAAPIPIAMGMAGFDFQAAMAGGQPDMPSGTAGFVAVYGIALVIVLIALAARLALVNPAIICERRGVGVIRRSFVLTRGIAWKVVGVIILFAIVAIVAVLAAQTVFGSILQLIAGGEGDVSVATVLTSILVGAVTTGFTVLATAFTAKLYLAVRDAREAIVNAA